jgi:hypothetical protein
MEALATALVTALATKAFEKVGEKLGENTSEKATGLIKSLFKPNELISLNLSAEHLSEPIQQGKLIGKLEDRLANQPDIAQQLQVLIDVLKEQSNGGRTTNIGTLKGNYIEKNEGNITQHYGNVIHTNKFQNKTEVVYKPNLHITDKEAKQIKDKIDEIIKIRDLAGKFTAKDSKSKYYRQIWAELYKRYKITKYTLLPKSNFVDCMSWLQSEIAYKHTPTLRNSNNPEWRKNKYAAIHARARNELGMKKEELYLFAFQRLKLKQPIISLTDLNDTNLGKLYKILFA